MDIIKWILWVFANTIGAALGWALCINLVSTIDLPTIFNFPGPLHENVYEYSVILGVTISLAQWLVLSPLVKANLWILATTAGWVIGFTASGITFVILFFLLYGIASPLTSLVIYAVSGSVLGVVIGVFQWLILYNQVTGAGNWILANVWGFGISYFWLIEGIYGLNNHDLSTETLKSSFVTAFGLIYGIITGRVLIRLRRC